MMKMFQAGGIKKITAAIRKYGVAFLAGFAFAVAAFVGINAAMEPVSKSEYCGSKCHEMNVAYRSWELSPHGANKNGVRVECIDCHLPPREHFFTHIAVKAYAGAKDIYKHHFGTDYDVEKSRKKVLANLSGEICLGCHDDLFARPVNPAARIAHLESLSKPDGEYYKCIKCHESTGHERTKKIFTP